MVAVALLAVTLVAHPETAGPADAVQSGVWHWAELKDEVADWGSHRRIFAGQVFDLSLIEVEAITLAPGRAAESPHFHAGAEELVLVKEGRLSATVNGETKVLGPGGVATALAGDQHVWRNEGTTPATYYLLRLTSRTGADPAPQNGPSQLIDHSEATFNPNPRGGSRNFFNRSTSTLTVRTSRNALLASAQNHPPHTHAAEEMVIILDGHVAIEIAGQRMEAVCR